MRELATHSPVQNKQSQIYLSVLLIKKSAANALIQQLLWVFFITPVRILHTIRGWTSALVSGCMVSIYGNQNSGTLTSCSYWEIAGAINPWLAQWCNFSLRNFGTLLHKFCNIWLHMDAKDIIDISTYLTHDLGTKCLWGEQGKPLGCCLCWILLRCNIHLHCDFSNRRVITVPSMQITNATPPWGVT